MADVIGYEERDAAVIARMAAGYPRFALHPFVRELIGHVAATRRQPGEQLWPLLNPRAAHALLEHVGNGRIFGAGGVDFVAHAAEPAQTQRARLWLQHTGGLLSSRGAEDALVRLGRRPAKPTEESFDGDAAAEVRRVLQPLFAAPAQNILLGSSGMSAVHAAFRTISEVQSKRGRTAWVQLGWLYLDTVALLGKFTPDPARDHLVQHDLSDLAALARLFAEHGPRIAGIVTEAPTNPLLQTGDLAAIAAIAQRHGAHVVVDPSMASPFNVDVLPHADVVTFSLTKYASHAGDVMAGAVVVNPRCPDAESIRAGIAAQLDPPYRRDLARLAAQIAAAPEVVQRINRNTPTVAAFLEAHPAVDRVWWSRSGATTGNFAHLARTPAAAGAVISFTLHRPLADFYDRVALAKGPSFGMGTTLLCPYVYLAHYELLRHPEGRAALAGAGLAPELVRLSVGTEPAAQIIATLEAALA